MIIKGGARKSGRFFAAHLMKAEDNERVAVVEMKNLWAEDVPEAFREMKSIAKGTRAENYFYTVSMNHRADEHLTPEQWDIAVNKLEANLGLTGHARFQVEHEKEGRTHRHIVWSRVDPDTMTVTPAKNDYYIHMQTGRELEREFNHQPTPDPIEHGHRAEKEFADWELFRAQDGRDPKEVKAEVTALFKQSDSGGAFIAALEDSGYTLCQGDRGYCIIDQAGDSHSLVRRLEGVKTAELRQYLSAIPLADLPTVAEAAAQVRARNEQEEEGSAGGAAQPVGEQRTEQEPQRWVNPKLRILEKFAHDHPALAPPDSVTFVTPRSVQDFAEIHKNLLQDPDWQSPLVGNQTAEERLLHAWQTEQAQPADPAQHSKQREESWQEYIGRQREPGQDTQEQKEITEKKEPEWER